MKAANAVEYGGVGPIERDASGIGIAGGATRRQRDVEEDGEVSASGTLEGGPVRHP